MCFWSRWFSPKAGSPVAKSSPDPRAQHTKHDDENDSTHSEQCSVYNALSLQETGYIDQATLQAALKEIFRREGPLDFGIMVGRGPIGDVANQ